MSSKNRIPLNEGEMFLLKEPVLDKAACRGLLEFYQAYHEKNLTFFVSIRKRWHRENPGEFFPGLCANINPITGEFREPAQQRLWGWGDARGLGIWAAFLNLDRVPDKMVSLFEADSSGQEVNLKAEMEAYLEILVNGCLDRYEKNDGNIPFSADRKTGLPDGDPRNKKLRKGEIDFSNIFAVNGFAQYGILKDEKRHLDLGLTILDTLIQAIENETVVSDLKAEREKTFSHGSRMICCGLIGEILKTIDYKENKGVTEFAKVKSALIQNSLPLIEHILDNFYRENPVAFWEKNDEKGKPVEKAGGEILVDPGHATECAGFLSELVPFLPETWGSAGWTRQKVLDAALNIHLFADRIGMLPTGVMSKFVDLKSGNVMPDEQAINAGGQPTSPWWTVREHCAAALRLYTLSEDERCVETFRKAQNASYLYYPNKRIGDQMIQTINPHTLEPVDIAPATGNLDPMHDPRARLREMENLEILLNSERS